MTRAESVAKLIRDAANAAGVAPADLDPGSFAKRSAELAAKVSRRTEEGVVVHESVARAVSSAGNRAIKAVLDAVQKGQSLTAEQTYLAEALIQPELRPVGFVNGGDYDAFSHPLWIELNTNQAWRANLKKAIASVGRIELPYRRQPDQIYGGTGFVVGPGLLMTNRHVAELFAYGLGDRTIDFRPGRDAGFDLLREQRTGAGTVLTVRRVRLIHPYWDCALLEVEGLPATTSWLTLTGERGSKVDRKVAVIGYPAFDPRNPEDVQNDVMENTYQVKRLQPGTLGAPESTASFGKTVQALTHTCSTLGGNSGSAIIDLQTGHVLGLHFGGAYQKNNYAAPADALAADGRLHDAGVKFDVSRPEQDPPWADYWSQADSGETPQLVLTRAAAGSGGGGAHTSTRVQAPAGTVRTGPDGGVDIEIPLRITVRLGGQAVSISAGGENVAEAPARDRPKLFFDENYAQRPGYRPGFLGEDAAPEDAAALVAPMPSPQDQALAARLDSGGIELKYENFSVVMHATRRLALMTASNVTAEDRLKRPGGKSFKRGRDVWRTDRRLSPDLQLPEYFYENDEGLFDKGHVVRRDDVSWGRTVEDLLRADADSYHVTNCSPQVSVYNQSSRGEDNWGDLENVILSQASTQRLCVFAGPVLAKDDEIFVGRLSSRQTIRLKLPRVFWKVVVARDLHGLAAFGFTLEQDLSDVPLTTEGREAFSPGVFKRYMEKLSDITAMAGVTFHPSLLEADRYGKVGGAEVAHLIEARPRLR